MYAVNYANVVLYHKGCFDGVCAAWVYRNWLRTHNINPEFVKFYGINPNQGRIPKACTGARVLVLDLCYKQPRMNILLREAASVIVLDHHKTSQGVVVPDEYKDKAKIILDMSRSGCQMAYDFLFPGTQRPQVVEYIGGRDLWKWDLPEAKEITAYIYSKPATFETLEEVNSEWNHEKYVANGKILLDAKRADVIDIAKSFFLASFIITKVDPETKEESIEEHIVKVGDCWWANRSDVGNYLMETDINIDFAVLYSYYADTKKFSVSLRGKDKIDLSKVAEHFGGGGHPNASAFQSTHLDFIVPIKVEEEREVDDILE